MDYEHRSRQPKNIDGFINRSYLDQHTALRKARTAHRPHQSASPPQQKQRSNATTPRGTFSDFQPTQQAASMGNGQSMIGMTLPNSQYRRQYAPPKTVPKKSRGIRLWKRKDKSKRWSWKRRILSTFLILLAILIGFGAWIDWNINKVFHCGFLCDTQALFGTTTLKGEAQGRVNILLAGYQGKQSDEGALTDSIMIVSIDTKNNTAFTMSIPRDLWVHISGRSEYEKINAANTVAHFNKPGYFYGGMGQLQKIVEKDFHIPIDYYALIDYKAFEDAVNAVGGITVDIKSPDPRGLYDPNVNKVHGGPVRLPNGPVKLDGLQALALALARGDSPYAYGFPLSDINREQHQRQMLIALEQKAASAGVLTNPLDINSLFSAIGSNVKTDLNLQQSIKLAQLAHKLNFSNIKSYGLNYSGSNALLTTYVAPNGEDALIPKAGVGDYSQIQAFYQDITSAP